MTATRVQLYRATCTVCHMRSAPMVHEHAVNWTILHADACPDASTEIWPDSGA